MPTIVTANCLRLLNIKPLWTLRRGKLVKVLNSVSPDLVAVQECTETQERYILANLDGAWASASDYVNVGVMYRSDRYRKFEQRAFKLANKTAGNRKRYASGVMLSSYDPLFGDEDFCVVSAHLASSGDGNSAASRPYQAQQLIDQLKSWHGLEIPTVLAGDWNESSHTGVATVLAASGFTEDRKLLKQTDKAIDRFFVNEGMTVQSARPLSSEKSSDHNFRQMQYALTAQPQPVQMWVRPVGDPIWTDPAPNRVTARDHLGIFTQTTRVNGDPLLGVGVTMTVDGQPGAFLRVATDENYRLDYLTAVPPIA